MSSTAAVTSRVLLVTASPRGQDSHSAQLADGFLRAYRDRLGNVEVDTLDTFTDLVPFGGRHVRAKMAVIAGGDVPDAAADDWSQVRGVAERLKAADTLVFAVPMWNGGIPWSLKLFIDTVTQPGIAFNFSPTEGYSGLLGGRRAVTIYTSRVFAPGRPAAFGADHQAAYLHWWLRYCGIDDIHELRLQPTYPGEDFAKRRYAATMQAHDLGLALAATAAGAAR
jgi:FMN-dependent NADH-azoreductase